MADIHVSGQSDQQNTQDSALNLNKHVISDNYIYNTRNNISFIGVLCKVYKIRIKATISVKLEMFKWKSDKLLETKIKHRYKRF